MTGGTKYLRAADVARLIGASTRTVRPGSLTRSSPLPSSVAPGLWQGRTLNACFAHLLTFTKNLTTVSENMAAIQHMYTPSGKHSARTCSIYSMIWFPNGTF